MALLVYGCSSARQLNNFALSEPVVKSSGFSMEFEPLTELGLSTSVLYTSVYRKMELECLWHRVHIFTRDE